MFGLFTYSDTEIETGGRSFYGITLTRDVGTLKAGSSYPFALVYLLTGHPILRIHETQGGVVHEFKLGLEEG